jgi:hypothetical protein
VRTTLADLYSRYSARLAAAEQLAEIGADPVADTDDVTQDTWLLALQLLALPEPEHAWSVLTGLLDQAIAAQEASRHREFPVGMALPAVRGFPPAPLEPAPMAVELRTATTSAA